MTWARLDDEILDNKKITQVGVLGFALHVAAITYCARNLTDGFLAAGRLPALCAWSGVYVDRGNPTGCPVEPRAQGMAGSMETPDVYAMADRLIEVGLWERVKGGYQLHDYLDYNPSKSEVLAKRTREQARKRPQGAGSVPADPPQGAGSLPRICRRPVPVPVPQVLPPLLTSFGEPPQGGQATNGGVDNSTKPKRPRRIRARLPDEWAPSDEAVAFGRSLGFSEAELERVTDEFCTYWWGEGKAKADWDATYQNRLIQLKQGARR